MLLTKNFRPDGLLEEEGLREGDRLRRDDTLSPEAVLVMGEREVTFLVLTGVPLGEDLMTTELVTAPPVCLVTDLSTTFAGTGGFLLG